VPGFPRFSGEVWAVLRRLEPDEAARDGATVSNLAQLDRAIRAVVDGEPPPPPSPAPGITLEGPAQRALVLGRKLAERRGAPEVELRDLVAAVSAVGEGG
jgi:hypothetical protein